MWDVIVSVRCCQGNSIRDFMEFGFWSCAFCMCSSPNKYIARPCAFDNKVQKLPVVEVYYDDRAALLMKIAL